LNSNAESRHPCPIPVFRRNGFNCLPFHVMLAIDLFCIYFIMLRSICSIPSFFCGFIIRNVEFCQKIFCNCWEDHMVFSLASVYMLYEICRCLYVERSLHS
jgi:hypothetical protein